MVTTLLNAKELKEKTLRAAEILQENDFRLLIQQINDLASKGVFNCVVSQVSIATPHGVSYSKLYNVLENEAYYGYLKKCGYNIDHYTIDCSMGSKTCYYNISWKDV